MDDLELNFWLVFNRNSGGSDRRVLKPAPKAKSFKLFYDSQLFQMIGDIPICELNSVREFQSNFAYRYYLKTKDALSVKKNLRDVRKENIILLHVFLWW